MEISADLDKFIADLDKLMSTESACDDVKPLIESNILVHASIHTDKHTGTLLCSKEIIGANKKGPFTCVTCNKAFTRKTNLIQHKRFNLCYVLKRKYVCGMCMKEFSKSNDLKRHETVHTGERPFICQTCHKGFARAATLRKHQIFHTEVRSQKTVDNKKSSFQKSSTHKLKSVEQKRCQNSERRFACKTWKIKFSALDDLKRHKIVHFDNNTNTFHKSKSNQFELLCRGERKYACEMCMKKFSKSNDLKRHETVHTGERPFICQTCYRGFARAESLRKHQAKCTQLCSQEKSDDNKNTFNKSFIHNRQYRLKRKSVRGIFTEEFSKSSDQKEHEAFHFDNEKDSLNKLPTRNSKVVEKKGHQQIDTCKKEFLKSSDLGKHEAVHFESKKGEMKISADLDKFFADLLVNTSLKTDEHTDTTQLYSQEIIEANKKSPFICVTCNKAFKRKINLIKHRRFNLCYVLKRKYACEMCMKEFSKSNDLKRHETVHTGERPFICQTCYRGFARAESLRKHQVKCTQLCSQKKSDDNKNTFNKSFIRNRQYRLKHKFVRGIFTEEFSKSSDQKEHEAFHFDKEKDSLNKIPTRNSKVVEEKGRPKIDVKVVCNTRKIEFLKSSDLRRHKAVHFGNKKEEIKISADLDKFFADLINLSDTDFACDEVIVKPLIQSNLLVSTSLKTDEHTDTQQCSQKIIEANKKSPFICVTCNKGFMRKINLIKHRRFNLCYVLKRKYVCGMCMKDFSKSNDLKRHETVHTGERPFICPTCHKGFARTATLRKHQVFHTPARIQETVDDKNGPFICVTCSRSFHRRSHMLMHIKRQHKSERRFSCDACKKDFAQECDLRKHEVIHAFKPSFICEMCKKVFTRASHLHDHGGGRFACKACHKRFTRSSAFSFVCKTCGKRFGDPASLSRHENIHSGERRFVCATCGRHFSQSSALRTHEDLHTGERRYICGTCSKSFRSNSALYKHRHTHDRLSFLTSIQQYEQINYGPDAGSSSYICTECDQLFKNSELDEHIRTVHWYGCGICGEMSNTRDQVKTCFYNHPSLGCGICGEMSNTRDQARTCFYNHPSLGCGICAEMFSTSEQVKTRF